jgi:hypothetical protein
VFCTAQWLQKYTTYPPKKGRRELIQWGSGGWEAEACTPPGVLLRFVGVGSMSHLICMSFFADLIAYSLNIFISAVVCRPVTPRLWSGFRVVAAVVGACCS